jgi:hypothetical protein
MRKATKAERMKEIKKKYKEREKEVCLFGYNCPQQNPESLLVTAHILF